MNHDVIEGTWRGHTQYQCPLCPYNTLDQDRMARHMAYQHRDDPGPLVTAAQAAQEQEASDGETGRSRDQRAGRVRRRNNRRDDDGGGHDEL